MEPLKLVQVGLGGFGQDWHQHVLTPSHEIALVAYVDLDQAMLAAAQQRLGLPPALCYATAAEAFAATDSDAVLITASLGAHVPVARAALEAGKHVLVEKPFAPSLAEGQELVALAQARGLTLMVSQNYRFFPAVQAAAALVREGTLGPVDLVTIDFRRNANDRTDLTHRHFFIRHPLLLDMAIHHFDMMRYVLGQTASHVHCRAWNPPWSNFREPAEAAATVAFDGGATVSYRGSWLSPGTPTPWAGAWRIECQHGEISFTSRADRGLADDTLAIRAQGQPTARPVELPDMPLHDRKGSLAAFVAAVRSGEEPHCSGRDNLGSLALTYAAIAAAESGAAQAID
ncbi:MAG: Gfo/Idh/MocA family oxidoreductase [Roseiflexaceae bacterium]|nr:Gfo/Idh/MocA family oxidoreductase [Roseiflexaceae bacterium]